MGREELFQCLTLPQIEDVLDIGPIQSLPDRYESKTFDTWVQLEEALNELREINRTSYHLMVSIYGYEIVFDHYVKLYYHIHYTNA